MVWTIDTVSSCHTGAEIDVTNAVFFSSARLDIARPTVTAVSAYIAIKRLVTIII